MLRSAPNVVLVGATRGFGVDEIQGVTRSMMWGIQFVGSLRLPRGHLDVRPRGVCLVGGGRGVESIVNEGLSRRGTRLTTLWATLSKKTMAAVGGKIAPKLDLNSGGLTPHPKRGRRA